MSEIAIGILLSIGVYFFLKYSGQLMSLLKQEKNVAVDRLKKVEHTLIKDEIARRKKENEEIERANIADTIARLRRKFSKDRLKKP